MCGIARSCLRVLAAFFLVLALDLCSSFHALHGCYPCGMGVRSRSTPEKFTTLLMARVALTREKGSNDKLRGLLEAVGVRCVEIPCIAFTAGPDLGRLTEEMKACDIVVISSPHAARVFLEYWEAADKPEVKISTVGKGTSKPLIEAGLHPFFEPSDATAATLSAELPESHGKKVLYPTSAIAENTMQVGLESRGFQVTRLNTYNTIDARWTDQECTGDCEW